MSGKGTASGTNYESDAFAYVAVHILAKLALNWFGEARDIPVAIRAQAGTAGDDLLIRLVGDGYFDVQAKHGASGNKDFITAAVLLFEELHLDPALRGVILVDSTSTGTVRTEFATDAQKLADGVDVKPQSVMRKVLAALASRGVTFDSTVLRRFRLIVRDLDTGMQNEEFALQQLAAMIRDPLQVQDAWSRLGKEGLRMAKAGGEMTRANLEKLLWSYFPPEEKPLDREAYLDWAIKANATFLVAPLPEICIDSLEAWDELTPPIDAKALFQADADAIRNYHAWDEKRGRAGIADEYSARRLLEEQRSSVIIGGAGGGKSTLTHRLVREACEAGMLALRVALKPVALAVGGGKSFDDALVEQAFQGSGIERHLTHALISRADFLIADGLDETDPLRTAIASQLFAWIKGHPKVAVIVTTRPVGHAAGLLPGIPTLDLMPLTAGGTSRLAREIFAAVLRKPNLVNQVVEKFEDELLTNGAAAVAARNPLLLSCMIALALEGHSVPQNRATLFKDVIELLYRTPPHGRTPSVEKVNALVAWRVVEAAGWLLSESPALARGELTDGVAKWLERDEFGNAFACHRAAEEALIFWEERRLLERLRSGAREYLTFVHLNLGEYAAARSIANLTDGEVKAWLTRVRQLPQWRQVILIAAASGAADRIAAMLLELDDAADAHSREAMLAADCLGEMATPDPALVEKTINALAAKLGGSNELEAARVLLRLAPMAPERISRVGLRHLDHASPATKLTAESMVFAGKTSLIPKGLPRKWLNEYVPIRKAFLGKGPHRRSPLPEEAIELQQVAAVLAIDALFRTATREEAIEVAKQFVETQATRSLLYPLRESLSRYGAEKIVDPLIERIYGAAWSLQFNEVKHSNECLALLDAVARSVGAAAPNEDTSLHTLPLFSRVLAALQFWDLEFERVGEREDQESLDLVVNRVLRGIRIDRAALRRELASGYRIAASLTARGIFAHIRQVAMRVDWHASAAEPIAKEKLTRALLHSADGVVWNAAELLGHGAAGAASAEVIAEALANGRRYTCFVVTQFAPAVLTVEDAAAAIRASLKSGDDRPWSLNGIFEALEIVAPPLRQALTPEILAGIFHTNSFIAAAAASVLSALDHDCTVGFATTVRRAFEVWATRPRWCQRCRRDVPQRFCPKCQVGVQSPRSALLLQLIRCRAIFSDELQSLLNDDDHDVAKAAKTALTGSA